MMPSEADLAFTSAIEAAVGGPPYIEIAAARKDWAHLDLSVSYGDLARRGPALLLDHQIDNGSRIVLWTSVK